MTPAPEPHRAGPGAAGPGSRAGPALAPLLLGGLALAGTAYVALRDPSTGGAFPLCPLRATTGLDCPACGGLRAVHALTRGDLLGALDHNVLVTALLPVAVVLWVVWLRAAWGRGPAGGATDRDDDGPPTAARGRPPTPLPRLGRTGTWALAAVVLAFTVARNIPGVPAFAYLNSMT